MPDALLTYAICLAWIIGPFAIAYASLAAMQRRAEREHARYLARRRLELARADRRWIERQR